MMNLEIKSNDKTSIIRELKREGNLLTIAIDSNIYVVDIVKITDHEYSILHKGKSYNIGIIEKQQPKHYSVMTGCSDFEAEIIDDETRYMQNRSSHDAGFADSVIKAPMPGRVVKVLVNSGDKVEAGQPVIILSAMKMESEFKAGRTGIVTEVTVREGDTVENNQVLVVIEEL